MKRSKVNGVKCLNCNTTIISNHNHDFKTCNCEDEILAVSVDGGSFYRRRVYGRAAKWVELHTNEVVSPHGETIDG